MAKINRKPLPDQALLLAILSYDAESGLLTWKERSGELVDAFGFNKGQIAPWNAKHARSAAHTVLRHGYIGVKVLGVHYMAHRIIWKMMHGVDADHIDHINGLKSDNRLINLRNVDATENQHNRKISANNATGHSGVHWCRTTRKYVARIVINNSSRMLGRFPNLKDAIAARRKAECEHNFTSRRGRSMRTQHDLNQ
ncbi:HNH endonuclease [Agrobacterium rubi]|uniref:HNH endonuclease n=1 Tax=Agrobacterium rubi TaxID=28099 RepID=UPI001573FD5F|nr:HNH endonuclease [Agrobacterium rubi]NTE87241.1 HNH endonuclease [Agrobacterium rubi]NTF03175.1 HNH endonuclease [Agrobacterium rubi]